MLPSFASPIALTARVARRKRVPRASSTTRKARHPSGSVSSLVVTTRAPAFVSRQLGQRPSGSRSHEGASGDSRDDGEGGGHARGGRVASALAGALGVAAALGA